MHRTARSSSNPWLWQSNKQTRQVLILHENNKAGETTYLYALLGFSKRACLPYSWVPHTRAHMQLFKEHSVTVISARWATVDWSLPKEWSKFAWANLYLKLFFKAQAGNELSNILPKSLGGKSHHVCACICVILWVHVHAAVSYTHLTLPTIRRV